MSGKPIDAEDIAVLLRLQAALPNVGLNGWFEGVRVLARVIEHLTAAQQQPVGMVEAFEEYHKADHRDPAVAPEWEWWQAAWKAALAQQPAAAEQASGGCKGPNCTASATNDHKHSSECLFEHAANVASGIKSVEMGVEIAEHLTYVEWRGHRINLLAALAAQHQEPKS